MHSKFYKNQNKKQDQAKTKSRTSQETEFKETVERIVVPETFDTYLSRQKNKTTPERPLIYPDTKECRPETKKDDQPRARLESKALSKYVSGICAR